MNLGKVTKRGVSFILSLLMLFFAIVMDGGSTLNVYAATDNILKDVCIREKTAVREASIDNDAVSFYDDKKIFDANERKAIDEGAKAVVRLTVGGSTVNALTDKEKSDVKTIINSLNKDIRYVYYNIELSKQVGENSEKEINETDKDVAVSLTLSDTLVNYDDAVVRNYGIIRVHRGEAEVIYSDFDYNRNTISFKSDKFSQFIVFYYDEIAGLPIQEGGFAAVKLSKNELPYTGYQVRPAVKVWYSYQPNDVSGERLGAKKKIALKENVDYVLTYENNVNVGTGKVTITGIGDYSYSETREFKIVKRDAKAWKIRKMPTLSANGTDYRNTISENVVVYDGKNIVSPSEYSVVLNGSTVNAGKVQVSLQVNPDGNYRGQAKKAKATVNIISNAKYDLTGATVSMSSVKDYFYTGKEVKPKVKVTLDGKKLAAKYYTVCYANNTNAGTASVKVVGKGKCAGISKEIYFKIQPKDISTLKVKKYSKTYWRKSLTDIKPIIKNGKNFLIKDVDYEMEAEDISTSKFKKGFDTQKTIPVTITIKPVSSNQNYADYSSNHSGYKTTIYITKRNLSSTLTTKVTGDKVLNKDGVYEPVITVKYLNDVLVQNVDYQVVSSKVSVVSKNKVRKAKYKIKGIGLYKGTRTVTWTLEQEK